LSPKTRRRLVARLGARRANKRRHAKTPLIFVADANTGALQSFADEVVGIPTRGLISEPTIVSGMAESDRSDEKTSELPLGGIDTAKTPIGSPADYLGTRAERSTLTSRQSGRREHVLHALLLAGRQA
jgi:hypothetical protein